MTPPPSTSEPRSSAQRTDFLTQVAFTNNDDKTEVAVDLGTTNFRSYSLYAASSNPDPRSNTNALDEEPTRPASGRLIGDGQFVSNETYTVQVTYIDEHNRPQVASGQVPAHDAVPNSQVSITLS